MIVEAGVTLRQGGFSSKSQCILFVRDHRFRWDDIGLKFSSLLIIDVTVGRILYRACLARTDEQTRHLGVIVRTRIVRQVIVTLTVLTAFVFPSKAALSSVCSTKKDPRVHRAKNDNPMVLAIAQNDQGHPSQMRTI